MPIAKDLVVQVFLLTLLAGPTLPAVVLPRPPSSPNYIPQVYGGDVVDGSKSYNVEKALYQSTNVEKPQTKQDYRFLEIEVRDGDNLDSLDIHGLVQAVLNTQRRQQQEYLLPQHARRLDLDDEFMDTSLETGNMSYPHPEVIPHSILGVRDVGLGPSQRHLESTDPLEVGNRQQHFLLNPSQATKNLDDEKLYYLKSGRPKVYVNFRGRTGNFRQDTGDSRVSMRFEPSAFLRATQPYSIEKKTKSSKLPPKKYDPRIHGSLSTASSKTDSPTGSTATTSSTSTTENAMVTSSELPKQIPAPPSRIPSRSPITHTTPVQRYIVRRTDILPGYAFAES